MGTIIQFAEWQGQKAIRQKESQSSTHNEQVNARQREQQLTMISTIAEDILRRYCKVTKA